MYKMNEVEAREFNAYIKEYGKLPPVDHPTMGECSRWGRDMGNGAAFGFVVAISTSVAITFWVILTVVDKMGWLRGW